jgi:hypothetical protein
VNHTASRRTAHLWLLLMLAGCYGVVLNAQGSLTGVALLDGALGLALGLYICSHPAAAAIDLFYLDRLMLHQLASGWADLWWLLLNVLVMLVGCLVTVAGATQFVGPTR